MLGRWYKPEDGYTTTDHNNHTSFPKKASGIEVKEDEHTNPNSCISRVILALLVTWRQWCYITRPEVHVECLDMICTWFAHDFYSAIAWVCSSPVKRGLLEVSFGSFVLAGILSPENSCGGILSFPSKEQSIPMSFFQGRGRQKCQALSHVGSSQARKLTRKLLATCSVYARSWACSRWPVEKKALRSQPPFPWKIAILGFRWFWTQIELVVRSFESK